MTQISGRPQQPVSSLVLRYFYWESKNPLPDDGIVHPSKPVSISDMNEAVPGVALGLRDTR